MHTVNEAGESAECHQTLSSLVGSENETNELPIYIMYACQVLFNSLTEYTSSFTQLEETLTKIETTSQTVDRCVRETFIPLLWPCTANSGSQLVFLWFMVNTLVMFWFLLQVYQFVFLFPRNLR